MVKINKDFLFSSFFTWPRELYQNPSSRYILLPVLRTFRDAGTNREKKKCLVYLSDQPLIGRFSTEIFRHFFQIVSTDGAIGKNIHLYTISNIYNMSFNLYDMFAPTDLFNIDRE